MLRPRACRPQLGGEQNVFPFPQVLGETLVQWCSDCLQPTRQEVWRQ